MMRRWHTSRPGGAARGGVAGWLPDQIFLIPPARLRVAQEASLATSGRLPRPQARRMLVLRPRRALSLMLQRKATSNWLHTLSATPSVQHRVKGGHHGTRPVEAVGVLETVGGRQRDCRRQLRLLGRS